MEKINDYYIAHSINVLCSLIGRPMKSHRVYNLEKFVS